MAGKVHISKEQFYQERIPIDFEGLRANIKLFRGLTDDEIVVKFRDAGFNLPKDCIIIDLPKVLLKDKIAKIENKKDNVPEPPWKEEEGKFINWPRTLKIPVQYKFPANESELAEILKSSTKNEKVGVMGSGHSWSNIFVGTDGFLINMDSFYPSSFGGKKVKIAAESENKIVISPGCSFMMKHQQLQRDFGKDDYVLPSNVIYTDIHYVGVVSGGCHGCHFRGGPISDRVENIVLYDAKGDRVQIPKDEIPVAAIGLGTIGIISEIEMKTEPERRVVVESHMWTMQQIMQKLETRPKDWISFEVFWIPFGGITPCQAISCLFTGELPDNYPHNDQYYCLIVRDFHEKSVYNSHAKEYIYKDDELSNQSDIPDFDFGNLIEAILTTLRKIRTDTSGPQMIGYVHKLIPLLQLIIQNLIVTVVNIIEEFGPILTGVYDSIHYLPFIGTLPISANDIELCFTCGKDGRNNFDHFKESFEKLDKLIRFQAAEKKFPVNLIAEGRIVGSSRCPLSPSYSADEDRLFFYLQCITFSDTPHWKEFNNLFFNCIKEIYNEVRPHLAKEWTLIEGIEEHLKNVAGDGIDKLRDLQKRYDPNGKFMPPGLEKLFQ